jgi:hypothetical protein
MNIPPLGFIRRRLLALTQPLDYDDVFEVDFNIMMNDIHRCFDINDSKSEIQSLLDSIAFVEDHYFDAVGRYFTLEVFTFQHSDSTTTAIKTGSERPLTEDQMVLCRHHIKWQLQLYRHKAEAIKLLLNPTQQEGSRRGGSENGLGSQPGTIGLIAICEPPDLEHFRQMLVKDKFIADYADDAFRSFFSNSVGHMKPLNFLGQVEFYHFKAAEKAKAKFHKVPSPAWLIKSEKKTFCWLLDRVPRA